MSSNRPLRKTRTREHVIADLAVNHIERQVLLCGYTVERIFHDYGVDLVLYTYDQHGAVENEQVLIQVKATDSVSLLADGTTIAFTVDVRDLMFWEGEIRPVILVLYDAQREEGVWLYVQAYLAQLPQTRRAPISLRRTTTVHLDRTNRITPEAIRIFAYYRDTVYQQVRGIVRHEE